MIRNVSTNVSGFLFLKMFRIFFSSVLKEEKQINKELRKIIIDK